MPYGDKRDYPKIEIWRKHPGPAYACWRVECVTTWVRTCKEAKARFLASRPDLAHAADQIQARFAKA